MFADPNRKDGAFRKALRTIAEMNLTIGIFAIAVFALGGCAEMTSPSLGQPKHLEMTFNEIPRGVKEVALNIAIGGEVSEKNPAIAAAVEWAFVQAFQKRGINVRHAPVPEAIEIQASLVWEENALLFPGFVNKFHLEARVASQGRLRTDNAWSKGLGCVAICPVDEVAEKLAGEVAEKLAARF